MFYLPVIRFVTSGTSKLHSIMQVRMEPVISYSFNTIIVEPSEMFIIVDYLKCFLYIKKYSTSMLPKAAHLPVVF